MAVVSVEKLYSQTSPGSGKGHRKYRSAYQVITDDITDAGVTVVELTRTPGPLYLPQIGDWYLWHNEQDLWAFMVAEPEVRFRDKNKSRKMWDVLIEHTTVSTKRDNTTQWENPLNEPWQFNRVADEWTDGAQRDAITGKPIANSAHQPYTGKDVEILRVRAGYELEKNIKVFNQNLIESTEGHTNSSTVVIKGKSYPPRHILLRPITVQELHNTHVGFYYRHKFKIDTRPNGFNVELVDRGTKHLVGTDPTDPTHFSDILDPITKHPIPAPGVPLDGSGGILPAAAIAAGNLVTNTFTKEPTAELNFWNFPA